jgi:hypothetical protein
MLFDWHVGAFVFLQTASICFSFSIRALSLVVLPLVLLDGDKSAALACAYVAAMISAAYSTCFAALLMEDRHSWRKLLAVPAAPLYHLVFNVVPSIVGMGRDIFLFGSNTNFAPEQTFVRGRLWRVAIAFRLRRALLLALRAAFHNDVPFGAFWFGWGETLWTPNGFTGWTSNEAPRPIFVPPAIKLRGPVAAEPLRTLESP